MLLFGGLIGSQAIGQTGLPPECSALVSYGPAETSIRFADIHGDNDIAITSFEAKCSQLKAAYVWIHEESNGLIAAQILRDAPYGSVIATGVVSGQSVGKQRIDFSADVFLETGEVYYLKFFKGEPATISGSLARAAEATAAIEGYNTYGPLPDDLAHELLFGFWEGAMPNTHLFDERKELPHGYEGHVNRALHAGTDVWGEAAMARAEGATYENIAGYLAPLKLMGTAVTESGVYYLPFGRPMNDAGYGPVALHVGDGSQISSQVSTGSKVTFFVGIDGDERFGLAEARLAQEQLEDGYQPVLVNTYTDHSGIMYTQESFADYCYPTTELVSFLKFTVSGQQQTVGKTNVRLVFSGKDLVLEGNVLREGNKVRAVLSPGARLSGGNAIVYEVDIAAGDRELYVARLLHPADCTPFDMDANFFRTEKAELKAFWNSELAKGAVFEVPEERVNEARKGLLIQNLFMGYLYSIGNAYQTWYQPEGNDAARILGEYGFMERQCAIHDVLLSVPFRRYRSWEMGELLAHAAQYYRLSKDTAFIHRHKTRFVSFLEDFAMQMQQSEHGVLAGEAFSGDIADPMVYLHHQAVAWRGMRDMTSILQSLGELASGDLFKSLADSLRNRLVAGLNQGKTALADGSLFLPTELFTKEKPEPYARISETKYGSYWNLCFPYAATSGLLDGEQLSGYYSYLKNHGAFLLGMVRFNYYPVAVGSYRKDGLPGYKTTGVDNVYGLNISRVMAMMDDPDRLVLSLYGKLAHGMTRNTFVSGEGDTVGPYPGEYYRTSYLGPSSFNNSWFLLMLRLMLVNESEGADGTAEKLQLAYFTPRAWLEHGKQINVQRSPTSFGTLGYVINSEIDRGEIGIRVELPEHADEAQQIAIRLRTPGQRTIKRVRLNGKSHRTFDPTDETIDLTGKEGLVELTVFYE